MSVQKNQVVTVEITGFSAEGSGVGKYNGMAVFTPYTAAGDTAEILIVKAQKSFAYGKLIKLIKPSPLRDGPGCPVYSKCGGCAFRHIKYEAELAAKRERVRDALKRIAKADIEPEPIIGSELTDGYRNKALYPVRLAGGKINMGFFAPRSHRVVPCTGCLLQPPVFEPALKAFEYWTEEKNISVYDEESKSGYLRGVYLRAAGDGDVMACAVVSKPEIIGAETLIKRLKDAVPLLKSVIFNINPDDTNVVLGKECRTVWGDGYLEDALCGLSFKISPLSFYQVNRPQAEKLYAKAAEYAALTGGETLLDLYCGAGAIGLTMAGRCKKVIGAEIVPEAVADAKQNAALNGISNAEFICADVAGAAEALKSRGLRPDVVVLDPPRKGCAAGALKTVAAMGPGRIVYVSCDPATLARDVAALVGYGYRLRAAAPVDMFPRTAHVETVTLLQRRDQQLGPPTASD